MTVSTVLKNVRLIGYSGLQNVVVEDGRITAISDWVSQEGVDMGGDYVSLGGGFTNKWRLGFGLY